MVLSPGSLPPFPSPGNRGGSGWGPFDDQRIDHREALSLRVDDDRVKVDFLDQIGMIGGKTRQGRDQFGQGVAVGERRPARSIEQRRALELAEERQRLSLLDRNGRK